MTDQQTTEVDISPGAETTVHEASTEPTSWDEAMALAAEKGFEFDDEPEGEELHPMSPVDQDDEEEPEADPVDAAALGAARNALKRSGLDDELLEGFSDEQLLALGEKFQAVVADRDRDQKPIKDAKELVESLKEKEAEPVTGQPAIVSKEHLDAVRETLELEMGADGVEAMASLMESVMAPLAQANAQLRKDMGLLVRAEHDRTTHQMRGVLAKDYPALGKDDSRWGEVVKEAQALSVLSRYHSGKDTEGRWRAAVLLTESAENPPSSKKSPKPSSSFPNRGRKTKSETGTGIPTTAEEAAFASFQHLTANPGDIRGARRAGGYTNR